MNLYHYCSNQSLLEILRTRELWASELSLSNDHLEGKWTREVFLKLCEKREISPYEKERLLRQLDSVQDFFGAGGFCLSEKGDLLSQWRGYADNGAGVSIGFARSYLEKLTDGSGRAVSAVLRQAIYDPAQQEAKIEPLMEKVVVETRNGALRNLTGSLIAPTTEDERRQILAALRRLTAVFVSMLPLLYTLKNPAFEEEHEWRLISYFTRKGNRLSNLPNLKFNARGDRIVPIWPIPLSLDGEQPIEKIILGPRNITPKSVILTMTEKYGFSDVEVVNSCASYR